MGNIKKFKKFKRKIFMNTITINNIFISKSAILLRRCAYFLLYYIDKLLLRKNNLFILCYHSIYNDDWFYSVKMSELKKQIEFLKKKGYQFITLDDIYKHVIGAKPIISPSVAITFDDGYSDVLNTFGLFEKEKITPAIFLISNTDCINRKQLSSNKRLLNEAEIKIIQKHGWEIGSHSSTHSKLTEINSKELSFEIADSKKILERKLQTKIKYFAYPFGAYNNNILKEIQLAGYKMAITLDDAKIQSGTNVFTIPRIGVNNTHTISEFKTIFSPNVISFRKIIKKILANK